MPTLPEIRDLVRRQLEERIGLLQESALSNWCLWLVAIALDPEPSPEMDLPPDLMQTTRDVRRDFAEPIRLLQAEGARLEAEASVRGLSPRAAKVEALEVLHREFVRIPYRTVMTQAANQPRGRSLAQLREDVQRKFLSHNPQAGEERIRAARHFMAHLAFDPSGTEVRSGSTDPDAWGAETEAYIARVAEAFGEEINALRREVHRLDAVACLDGLSTDDRDALIERRLAREFLGDA